MSSNTHPSLAVILAAGQGTRIQEICPDRPKGLLEVGGVTLIERSLQLLFDAGISRVVIVTGYLNSLYEQIARSDPRICCTFNSKYASSGSMYSLFQAQDCIDSDFILLESDLLYEKRALDAVLHATTPNAVLISGVTGAGDEVWVYESAGLVQHISKLPWNDQIPAGELTGITRISTDLLHRMYATAKEQFTETLMVEYETDTLSQVSKHFAVPYALVPDLVWCEIDNAEQLRRARNIVWPQLQEQGR